MKKLLSAVFCCPGRDDDRGLQRVAQRPRRRPPWDGPCAVGLAGRAVALDGYDDRLELQQRLEHDNHSASRLELQQLVVIAIVDDASVRQQVVIDRLGGGESPPPVRPSPLRDQNFAPPILTTAIVARATG